LLKRPREATNRRWAKVRSHSELALLLRLADIVPGPRLGRLVRSMVLWPWVSQMNRCSNSYATHASTQPSVITPHQMRGLKKFNQNDVSILASLNEPGSATARSRSGENSSSGSEKAWLAAPAVPIHLRQMPRPREVHRPATLRVAAALHRPPACASRHTKKPPLRVALPCTCLAPQRHL
jgi:hypothetical protein